MTREPGLYQQNLAALRARREAGDAGLSTRLISEFLERIGTHNPRLNCYTHLDPDTAMKDAAAADRRWAQGRQHGLLDGLGVAVKGNIAVAGLPHCAGMRTRADVVAQHDAPIVRRLRELGAVVLGLTNMDEAAWGAATANPWFGACHNPARAGYTAGGSSGGSAAAVAAGLCNFALGTDTLGSIRIPASYCGIAGFKPTHARLPIEGIVPVSLRFDHVGPMARDCGEIVQILQELEGPVHSAPAGSAPDKLKGLTLGIPRRYLERRCEAEVAGALERVVARLRDAGCRVIDADLPLAEPDRAWRAALLLCEAELGETHADSLRERPGELSRELREMIAYAGRKLPEEMAAARTRVRDAALAVAGMLDSCDLVLTPTTPQTAFPLAQAGRGGQADFTFLANLAGAPALSVPAGTAPGLPIGMQLMARPGTDHELLATGAALEGLLS